MLSRARSFLFLVLATCSLSVSAVGNWSIGAGIGFLNVPLPDSNTVGFSQSDEEAGGPLLEFYFINKNLQDLSYVFATANFEECVSSVSDTLCTSFPVYEIGVAYNLVDFGSGYFIDVGYRKGFSSGDSIINFPGGDQVETGFSKGYDKVDIGVGKAFESVVFRAGLYSGIVSGHPTYVNTNTEFNGNDNGISGFQFSFTYWWQ